MNSSYQGTRHPRDPWLGLGLGLGLKLGLEINVKGVRSKGKLRSGLGWGIITSIEVYIHIFSSIRLG